MKPQNENSDDEKKEILSGARRYDTGHSVSQVPEGRPQNSLNESIAIIGMAGFFPGSTSLEDFCSRLERQESFFIQPPADHFPPTAVANRYGAFLENISRFDPDLFKLTALESEYLDPRQRLLLMSVWHALEDACYLPETLAESRTDVYVASEGSPYGPFMHAAEITPYSPTGAASSFLPNRISHAFHFNGKSIFIDTACSGSLAAVHQAMQALRRKEADYTIVGGVNLLLGDEVSLSFLGQQSLGIVADTQSCFPFQNSAKGFLPAEGVITVVLKRLSEAIRDNDNIHAVLLGSHVNHAGGKGTSLTMPSATAQADAIVGAYADAQISPWSVTYIEAHGASTVLADVEEIQAFKTGDRKLRDGYRNGQAARCKISTIKPNIGHANCVSGLMSLVRVVHSLKSAKKLGIKNFSSLSDRISLDGTRFYINENTEPWEQLHEESGTAIPRRAAINNFGAGGVNVHLILEEFVRDPVESSEPAASPDGIYFLALSAFHEEQLLSHAASLSSHLANSAASTSCGDLEALFVASRAALPRRLVFRYKNLGDLQEKLQRYRQSNGMKGYYLKRDAREKNDSVDLFHKHARLSNFVSTLSGEGDKAILFELWSLGVEEPLRRHFKEKRCLKQSLPRYPFAMREFWIQNAQRNRTVANGRRSAIQISPLLHENTSDLSEQKYTSLFTGEEFFLAEHIVKGQRVLPGVAYLEMARAAIVQATRTTTGVRLRNVVWARPILVGETPQAIHIRLKPVDANRIDFEIYSAAGEAQVVVHCQGSGGVMPFEHVPDVDLERLKTECAEFTIHPEECYGAFRAVGIHHGPAFQGLKVIHGKAGQAVAKLVLPPSVGASHDEFVLHPSLMDSAFQASLGLVSDTADARLPFALQELEIFSACPRETWVVVRNTPGWAESSKVKKVDIDLVEPSGKLCVRMRGFATRPVEGDLRQAPSPEPRLDEIAHEDPAPAPEPVVASAHRLSERIEGLLVAGVLKFLRISAKALDRNAEFNSFGFDSVSLTAFANDLNKVHGLDLDPTLFFEHTTIRQFAEYLARTHESYFATTLAAGTQRDAEPSRPAAETVSPARFSRTTGVKVSSIESASEPIAIVGMSGRFPMADDLNEFWKNLVAGRDCISEVPPGRWDWKEIYGDPKTEENKTNVKWGGFITGVDEFDPLFFSISPKEAELMDPQQRLLLMFIWNAIEDAGYSAQRISGTNTGIFVGTGASGYSAIIAKAKVPIEAYTSTGMVPSVGPNRMSYYLNFHGPSEPIETACSSSLVAIHRAVGAIRTGSCDMAIAGGVSTILTPDLHISFSKAGMLCEDGRCKTFSDRANGYVRGEGAGMLFLKKLRDAEAAGDHIYGVILGTAENHGGRTNSLTAPNPKAQADVVAAAHKNAGVDPRTITYIEAHGTGTGLGDPIEINGLKLAFNVSEPEAYCGVGSVKTNIGHLEVAAGVSGVIKVLLQMKHKTMAKSLHCEKINPYIQIEKSPFYVVKETTAWPTLSDADGNVLPRRAGVSSFGFGGVNAHVVIEEYVRRDNPSRDDRTSAILFSAKSAERLRDRVQQLHDYLCDNAADGAQPRLEDIAFTLQVGRDAMDERLALLVDNVADLQEKLIRVLAGDEDFENSFRGKAERHNPVLSILSNDEEASGAIDRWLQRGKLKELCELWVKGLAVDWDKLHRAGKPRRINLPAYPFAKQRCWVTKREEPPGAARIAGSAIHPLLHLNISTLREQRYRSTFSGAEFFLADHVLRGSRILPGVAYLEMARAAVRDAIGWEQLRLKNVTWTNPFIVDQRARKIDVVLSADSEDSISVKVVSETEDASVTVHLQCVAVRGEKQAVAINLADVRAQCTLGTTDSEEPYAMAKKLGFEYGPSFRTLETLHRGKELSAATIRLPAHVASSLSEFQLHPSVMDAALQASIALVAQSEIDGPALPYFAEEIEILGSCTDSMWSVVRQRQSESPDNRTIKTCDIDICHEGGELCVRMKGFSFVVLAENLPASPIDVPAATTPGAEDIQKILATTVSGISKMAPGEIELDRDLTEYGFDSISLVDLAENLNRTHQLTLTPPVFFEHPTIRSLSNYLLKTYPNQFESRNSIRQPIAIAPKTEQKEGLRFSAGRGKSEEPIAIVGMSGRFPMADDIDQYWDNLLNAKDCIREIPSERWDWKEYFGDPRKDVNKTNVKFGGFISGIDEFDPAFFGISPEEARLMDPTQRLLMQYVWKAIEDAGYSAESLSGSRTAIIVGSGASGYHSLVSAGDMPIESFTSTGMAPSFGPNRMSHFLNFHGPSEPIETACSSSLIALHRACLLIRNDICDMAVVGGINTILTPLLHISFSKAGMLSEDGRCKPFSDKADGYARGEGVGMLFVKRLKDAERGGDHIYGVIRGSAENHGGHSTWMTAPNPQAQADVIKTAYSRAGIDPRTITYIEAHGTGTALGDAVEINALKSVFGPDGPPCGIGSVKSNIGHLELAAGVAGVIKVLLQFRNKRLVRNLHGEPMNPYIDLKNSPFYVLQESRAWSAARDSSGMDLPLRAGVSAFGFGGVNAHVLVEEYLAPPQRPEPVSDEAHALVLSAKTPERLQDIVRNLHDFLERAHALGQEIRLDDLAYTLQVGRDAFQERMGIVVHSVDELRRKLKALSSGDKGVEGVYRGTARRRESSPAAFQDWVTQKSYDKILDLWAQGLRVDWSQFHRGVSYRRLSLPTYPFATEKYWIDTYGRKAAPVADSPNPGSALLYRPVFVECDVSRQTATTAADRVVIVCGTAWNLSEDVDVIRIESEQKDIGQQFEEYAIGLVAELQRIQRSSVGRDTLIQVIVPADEPSLLTGLSGLLAVAEQEHPNWRTQLVALSVADDPKVFLERIRNDSAHPEDKFVRYSEGRRQIRVWEKVESRKAARPLWKDDGVYLITGGAGVLGQLIADEIANAVATPVIILAGRTPLNDEISAKVAAISRSGARVSYRAVDIASRKDVAALVGSIRTDWGGLNGIIHTAGIVRDKTIARKTAAEFAEVFAPKVKGLVHLDLETQSISLDCFVLFSSAAAIFGNPGQADYATANAFMDAYARYRNRLVDAKQRHGRTLSINWPLWKEGGMQVRPDVQKVMEHKFGTLPMPSRSGIQALSGAFAASDDQILVLHGDPERIDARVLARPARRNKPASTDSLEEHVRNVVAGKFCQALAITDDLIDFDESFGDYGLDSMSGIQAVQAINEELRIELNATSLFDYATVNQLTRYIVREHRPEVSTVAVAVEPRVEEEKESVQEESRSVQKEPIAIIGMSGRFGRARSVEELWQNLAAGNDLIEEVTRWDLDAHYAAESISPESGCKHGGLLHDIDQFDPMFFSISAVEATYMDPQQRLFLEESWRALEDAGYAGPGTEGLSCGVYAGCSNGDYYHLMEESMPAQAFWGNAASIIPARIAYYMNLQGPAVAIDTACSSSLVAIHMACQGLWAGETKMALAGGVYVQATPTVYLLASRAGMLSPTGRCHTFDQAADGFVPGEGVGVLVLKRLSEAIADGDHIHGVIRGSGINQDGRTNGITAPSSRSQERLERQVYETFQVSAADIQMVEAHGTGTKLGDPIEFEALTRAFRKESDQRQYCALGSIKTNIGHAATAAGVAGVLRILLSLRHKQIPPSLNFALRNDNIQFDESPFYVNTQLQAWDVAAGKKRCAAVSSFSFNGTNAHMVIEEAPSIQRAHEARAGYLVVLSARSEPQLRQQVDQLLEYCNTHREADCGNIGFTLLVGRKHWNHRLAVVVNDVGDLAAQLQQWLAKTKSSRVQVADAGQKERARSAALKRYGNECIERAGAAKDAADLLEQLAAVAELYLQGYALDYHNLFQGHGYSRIGLPVYPFSRERYWIPTEAASDPVSESIVHREKTMVSRSVSVKPRDEETAGENVLLTPAWEAVGAPHPGPPQTGSERVMVIGADDVAQRDFKAYMPGASFLAIDGGHSAEHIRSALENCGGFDHLLWIAPREPDAPRLFDEAILDRQNAAVMTGFRIIKALLALGFGDRNLRWTVITHNCQAVVPRQDIDPAHAGLHGLMGSTAQEYANWQIRLVDLGDDAALLGDIFQLPPDPRGAAWAWRGNRWYRRVLLPCREVQSRQFNYRPNGVYVVIGGAGGIGEIWTEYVVRHANARVVWIGRRGLDETISRKLEQLSALGEAPMYIVADATNAVEMAEAYTQIKARYSKIDGVIHSAVGVFDQSLAEMTEDRFREGLSAKVDVTLRIAQTFRHESLDFILFFSSMDAFTTSHGKANYTSGCAFMDAYAHALSRETSSAIRVMNWGYWGNVGAGAAVPDSSKHRLARTGIGSIEPADGMQALLTLLAGPFNQLGFLRVTKALSRELFGNAGCVTAARKSAPDVIRATVATATGSIAALAVPRRNAEEEKRLKSTEELLTRLLLCQLESTGWLVKPPHHRRLANLQQESVPYGLWLAESVSVLASRGLLHSDGESVWIVRSELENAGALWEEWRLEKELWSNDPSATAMLALVEKTLQALPDILSGRHSATQVMFPNSSMRLVEGIYKHNRVADYFNELLASMVVAYVENRIQLDPRASIQILEIGAGTGGASAGIFEKLEPYKSYIREYCYTDVSKAFLIHGQREYLSKSPYLTCKIYDVEQPEKSPELETGHYDLVIASNVLHATKDIEGSLRNAKALLQENGLILINEIASKTLFSHLTFGLLEGWWLPQDREVRIPGCPALTPLSWKHVLEHVGFDAVSFPGIHAHDLGQQIIIGRSDGVVRESPHSIVAATPAATQSQTSVADRADIDDALLKIISRVTMVAPQNLQMHLSWAELGLDSILSMQVIQEIESGFGLRIYPNELIEHDTPEKLRSFIDSELNSRRRSRPPKTGQGRKPVVFVLSTPRAGSTLLRVMLAGHHQLFSPPELHLLPFADFGERADVLKTRRQEFLGEGLIKTLCQLKSITADEAKAITAAWTSAKMPIKSIYDELRALCPTKLLVDKSPSYASDLAILQKAEGLEANAFYIHIVRHPLSVMESFVRNRFDRLFSIKGDPWIFAEQLWHRYNANIDSFLSTIPSSRWIRIRYEDLVAQPLTVTRELFSHMGLEFDARVLDPYEGDRMTSGLHGVSLPLSDPNFKNHNRIESELAEVWKEYLDKTPMLSLPAVRLSDRYGYRLVGNQRRRLLPAQEGFLNRCSENPVWHILQSMKLKLERPLDLLRLKDCLQHLVSTHAALRSIFKCENGSWLQEEGDTFSVPVLMRDGSAIGKLRSELHECVDIRTRVNLACGVVDLGKGEYRILLVVHHLVADGVSMIELQRELRKGCLETEMDFASVQPDDGVGAYLDEVDRKLTPEVLNQHRQYWQDHIARNGNQEIADDVASEQEYQLRVPMTDLGWTPGQSKREFFLRLCGALYQCLSRWTGKPDITVAHRLHRRSIGAERDFSRVIGWFAGDVPVKVTVTMNQTLRETADLFRDRFASIPMGGVSYEILANRGEVPHCHDVCPVRLNYLPGNLIGEGAGVEFEKFEAPSNRRAYGLDLIVSPADVDCSFIVRYSGRKLSEAAVAEMIREWIHTSRHAEGVMPLNARPASARGSDG